MGQLAEAKAKLAAAGTEAEQAKIKTGLAEKEIKEKEPRAKKAEKEGEGLVKELAAKRAEVEKLKKRVGSAGWDEGKERDLLERQASHSGKITELMEVSRHIPPLFWPSVGLMDRNAIYSNLAWPLSTSATQIRNHASIDRK